MDLLHPMAATGPSHMVDMASHHLPRSTVQHLLHMVSTDSTFPTLSLSIAVHCCLTTYAQQVSSCKGFTVMICLYKCCVSFSYKTCTCVRSGLLTGYWLQDREGPMVVTIPQHLPHTAAMDPHRMTATAATAATDRHHTAAMAATAAMDRHHTADTARCRLGSTKGMGGRLDTALPHHLSQAASGCASHFRHQVSFYSNTDSCHISRQDLSVIFVMPGSGCQKCSMFWPLC